jgi:hypothetical protein
VHDKILKDPQHSHVFHFGLQGPGLLHAALRLNHFGAPGFVESPENSIRAG